MGASRKLGALLLGAYNKDQNVLDPVELSVDGNPDEHHMEASRSRGIPKTLRTYIVHGRIVGGA